jgi:type II secretory pathway pseudopilin PulG
VTIVLIVVGVLCAGIFVALFTWMRRSERDVDYDDLESRSTQTDEERRARGAAGTALGP